MRKTIIGVMGPGEGADGRNMEDAERLGGLVASEGWVLLTGGRGSGVMDAAARGAKKAGGLVIGILPSRDTKGASEALDIAVVTGMGSARNNVNVLSSDVVVACGMGKGTASETALALKAGKKVVLLGQDGETVAFFVKIGGKDVLVAESPEKAVEFVKACLG